MPIITEESLFNSLFNNHKEITMESLFNLAKEKNILSKEYIDELYKNYQNEIISYILETNKGINEDDSIDSVIKEESIKIINSINEYISSLTPYNAMDLLLNSNIQDLIAECLKCISFKQSELMSRYYNLVNKTKYLLDSSSNFKSLMESLLLAINKKSPDCYYYLLNGKRLCNNINLDELSNIFASVELEVSILSHFEQADIIRLLKNGSCIILDSRNITEMVLFNYVFNYFYKECISLIITDSTADILVRDINMKVFTIEDVLEIIETGAIEFSKDEKEYIINSFVKVFENEVVLNKRIDCFIKN